MSLRVERLPSKPFISYAVRMENGVSKYFLEHVIPCFDPLLGGYNWCAIATRICLCVKSVFFLVQYFSFKLRHSEEAHFPHSKAKWEAFPNSAEAAELKRLFPYECLWNRNAAWLKHSWLKMGTCFGQSLTAMKYHHYCTIPSGFSTVDFGNEPLYYQALHVFQAQFQAVLDAKNLMKNHGIGTQDLVSKEEEAREAWLFHYLRKSGVARLTARFLVEQYQELFSLPLYEVQNIVDSFPQMYRDAVLETTNECIHFHAHVSEEDVSQDERNANVCNFLLENAGVYILQAYGNLGAGHGMFLKMEAGKCLTYDPATKECFIVPHTREGIKEALKLMKNVIGLASIGGAVTYKVHSLH